MNKTVRRKKEKVWITSLSKKIEGSNDVEVNQRDLFSIFITAYIAAQEERISL